MPKKKKIIVSVIAIILVILIIFFSVIGFYFNLIDWNGGDDYTAPTGDDYISEDDMNLDPMSAVTDATGLQDYLKKWYNNGGDLMQSKNVVNVLLMGLDESRSHSDSMILLSINKVSKEIIMSSFFRDTYTYSSTYSTANGSNYMKLTEVYTFGIRGPEDANGSYAIEGTDSAVNFTNGEATATVTGEVAGTKVDYTLSCVWSSEEGTYPIEVKLGINPDYDVTGAAHCAFLRENVVILEGLNLASVHNGEYFLIAPPVKIGEAEAAFTRAVLVSDYIFWSGKSPLA